MQHTTLEQETKLVYKQKLNRNDILRYIKAIGLPSATFLLALIAIQSLAAFGAKLIAPLTAIMWSVGVICTFLMPSHRSSILTETHVTIGGYLVTLIAIKEIVAMMSGVSSEMMMAAFNQAIPITSGSAISGWLQNLLWIDAVMTPIAYVGMQVKRVFSFRKNNSKEKAFEQLRGINSGNQRHLK